MSESDPNPPRASERDEPRAGDADGRPDLDSLFASIGAGEHRCLELCPICRAADVLRASAPPELRGQWHTVQREALLTLKAAIEHYLERLDTDDSEPGPKVQDIPID